MLNWITEVFKIVKVQHTNSVTYLFEDYHGKSIAGAFYEVRVASRDSSRYIPRGKGAQEEKRSLRKVTEIRWITQFMDTQRQCVVKINLLYTFFPYKNRSIIQTYYTYIK